MPKRMNHAEYAQNLKNKTIAELLWIARDAKEAAEAMPDGENAGYYLDEVCYCADEIRARGVR